MDVRHPFPVRYISTRRFDQPKIASQIFEQAIPRSEVLQYREDSVLEDEVLTGPLGHDTSLFFEIQKIKDLSLFSAGILRNSEKCSSKIVI